MTTTEPCERRRLIITGVVQGVGFRPFMYRLAKKYGLTGFVANNVQGVWGEVQGSPQAVRTFINELPQQIPPQAQLDAFSHSPVPCADEADFRIRESDGSSASSATVLPDLAPCAACLQELFAAGNRRFRYPFINCTDCGPRFSIVERTPYDRANTAMKHFPLCEACAREYRDPLDRRFHAEPTACGVCGPQITCRDARNTFSEQGEFAIQRAAETIRSGRVVALKGVGGFQLLADAGNAAAVALLRKRKHRPHKPFAVMYPDVQSVLETCVVTPGENTLLSGAQRPIVLLARNAQNHAQSSIAYGVAPGNPDLGVMLPSSPLHYLLLDALRKPIVATSGNRGGEPICIDNDEALERLADLADLFLIHDRPILRPLDDSVVRVMDDKPVVLRRARGYAPSPIPLENDEPSGPQLVALGADLKNCVAGAAGASAQLSQHIGDLQSPLAMAQFERSIDELSHADEKQTRKMICDLHPGYLSTRWAIKCCAQPLQVQHHVAHLFSCMAEHNHRGAATGIIWDGSGYGEDGSIRGSEILYFDGAGQVARLACLLEFPLPGGTRAILDPRRTLAGLLYRAQGDRALQQARLRELFRPGELSNLQRVLERRINTPVCSSMGRLFDAVAVLLGIVEAVSFEGQAAMALEYAARESRSDGVYPFRITRKQKQQVLDWRPMLLALMDDAARGVATAECAARFHNTLVQMVMAVLRDSPVSDVFLSGGVFQNKRLLESTAAALRAEGFRVYTHGRIPPNDGGIALGQLNYVRAMNRRDIKSGEGGTVCV